MSTIATTTRSSPLEQASDKEEEEEDVDEVEGEDEEEGGGGMVGLEVVNELWDVTRVIPTEEEKVECRNDGCTDQAVAT